MSACTTSLTGDGAALVGALGRGHAVSNLVMRSFESCLHDPRHGYKFRNSKFRFDSIRFDSIRCDAIRFESKTAMVLYGFKADRAGGAPTR